MKTPAIIGARRTGPPVASSKAIVVRGLKGFGAFGARPGGPSASARRMATTGPASAPSVTVTRKARKAQPPKGSRARR